MLFFRPSKQMEVFRDVVTSCIASSVVGTYTSFEPRKSMEANNPVTFRRAPPPKATTRERFVASTRKAHSISAVRLAHDLQASPFGSTNLSTTGVAPSLVPV